MNANLRIHWATQAFANTVFAAVRIDKASTSWANRYSINYFATIVYRNIHAILNRPAEAQIKDKQCMYNL